MTGINILVLFLKILTIADNFALQFLLPTEQLHIASGSVALTDR